MDSPGQARRWRSEAPAFLATGLAFFALVLLQNVLSAQPGNSVALRLGGGLLLGVLLLRQPRPGIVLAYLAMACVAFVLARWLVIGGPGLGLGLGLVRAGEVALAYAVLRRLRIDAVGLQDLRALLQTLGITMGPVSLLGALASAWMVLAAHPGTTFANAVLTAWVAGAFSALVVLPPVLALGRAEAGVPAQRDRRLETVALALLTLVVCALSLLWLRRPYIVVLLPLLLVALRLGVFRTVLLGAANALLVVALERYAPQFGFALAYTRAGPLTATEVAFYAALAVVAPLLLSMIAAQRERARAQAQLASEQMQQIADSVPAIISQLDAGNRYRFVNRRFEEWLGVPPGQVLGRTPAEVFGARYFPAFARHVQAALAGDSGQFESRIDDGRELEVSYVPYRHLGSHDGYLVLARDISARKRAERALFEEKERAQVTLQSIGDAVVCCDPQLRVTLLNPIAETMTGWDQVEALGRPFDEVVRLVDIESGEPALSPLAVALRNDRIVALQANAALQRRDGLRSPIEDSAAPIHDRDGNIVGGVMVFHDVSESRAMALKMSHLAQHDYLTDLPNRVLLHDRVSHALSTVANGGRGAVLFLDLDHFKTINDSLGHQAGDHVLQEVAQRLLSTVRADDTVSRQGGDEFVLLLERLADPRDAARVAEKIIEAMQAPIVFEGRQLHVGVSIGIALFPQDASDTRALMKQADTALYHAKQAGRGRYSYFAASMSARVEQRLRLEHDLRQALDHDELFLVYQPKILRPEHRIIGMEALVRWRRADGSVVPPMEFVPVAEESGLIGALDAWVLRAACAQNRAWQDAGLPLLPVAVNVSLARLDVDALLARVAQVLAQSGLPPHCLEIEFTESQMFADQERAWRLIEGLRELGVRTAIDDFGTGYSSLSYLAQYRFDTIKIDRSFISDLTLGSAQDAVVQAIVALGRALAARVVAEGVETLEQARALEVHGCREIQGYLYSRPVDAAAMAGMLRARVVSPAQPAVATPT